MAVIDLIYSRNDALNVNPQGGQSHLSEGGSDWLWAVMACFSLALLVYYALCFRLPWLSNWAPVFLSSSAALKSNKSNPGSYFRNLIVRDAGFVGRLFDWI
ncbi:hypothetical protein FOMA001_g17976 [Fusarium oxysporum f. sp. matthiolae]|nr:hypothetical protein FOMA001_g17976 [Fusarium oxysporum f. sp. matthiolae]